VPWTWAETGGTDIDVEVLAEQILTGPSIEGVTFLGGEPFAQAEALALLGGKMQAAGLSVMTFTGYTIERLRRSSRPGWHDLLAVSDLLLDGPYRKQLTDLSRPWVGSSNQRFHFLTERYRHLQGRLNTLSNRLEIRLLPDGQVLVNGMIRMGALRALFGEEGFEPISAPTPHPYSNSRHHSDDR
jgi:anaerobic ribonucleoside-triphosphate reductase activating protein